MTISLHAQGIALLATTRKFLEPKDFSIELGETNDKFQLIIKTENLKLLPQKYSVTLSSKGISKFEGDDVRYFIAIESKSTYSKGE